MADTRTPAQQLPCQCHSSHAAETPMHPGHCCFWPASQTCHAAEVATWEAERDRRASLIGTTLGMGESTEESGTDG